MATRRWGGGLQTQRRLQAQYWSPVVIPTSLIFVYCKNGFCTNSLIYIRIPISRQIHFGSFVLFLTLYDSAQSVTCDGASLQIFVQTSTSGSRRFKSYAPCSPIGAMLFLVPQLVPCCFWLRSHNFSFFIQFASNRFGYSASQKY